MAITDNSFTPEEFESAIKQNPELLNHVSAILPKNNYVVRKSDEEAQYIETLKNQHISEHTAKFAPEIEQTLEKITGIKKNQNEKWTEFYPRVAQTLVQEKTKVDSRIKELEGKSNITDAERQQLTELRELQEKSLTDVASMKTAHQQEITRLKAERTVIDDIAPVRAKFSKDAKLQKAIDVMHSNTISEMMSKVQIDENTGKPIFFGADGRALTKDGLYLSASDIYAEKMKDFMDEAIIKTGAGGGPAQVDGLPADVNTQVKLTEHLNRKGLISGSKAFNEEFNKYSSKLPRM